MFILSRAQLIAAAILLAVLAVLVVPPALALLARMHAVQELSDANEILARLDGAHRPASRTSDVTRSRKAPISAFLTADTQGLATAQLQTYLADLARASHASLVSSTVQPPDHDGVIDIIDVRTDLDIDYEALQSFLYKLETGSPYVFVSSLKLRLAEGAHRGDAHETTMNAVLNVKAIWPRSAP